MDRPWPADEWAGLMQGDLAFVCTLASLAKRCHLGAVGHDECAGPRRSQPVSSRPLAARQECENGPNKRVLPRTDEYPHVTKPAFRATHGVVLPAGNEPHLVLRDIEHNGGPFSRGQRCPSRARSAKLMITKLGPLNPLHATALNNNSH